MPSYITNLIEGEPAVQNGKWDDIKDAAGKYQRSRITIEDYSEAKEISERQRKWYKGVCLPWLAKHDENQESVYWWDDEVKRLCHGLALLKKEIYFMQGVDEQKIPIGRLTISGVGRKNMTQFIEEILAKSVEMGWGVAPPDRELRK